MWASPVGKRCMCGARARLANSGPRVGSLRSNNIKLSKALAVDELCAAQVSGRLTGGR